MSWGIHIKKMANKQTKVHKKVYFLGRQQNMDDGSLIAVFTRHLRQMLDYISNLIEHRASASTKLWLVNFYWYKSNWTSIGIKITQYIAVFLRA